MKTLIVYISKHGCTETCAQKLAEKLDGEVEILNMKKSPPVELSEFDAIVVGGSIHAGQIQKVVKKFCENNMAMLLKKKLGLFICCMEEGENAQKQLETAYPAELRQHASALGLFGGEFNFEKMNFMERAIVKKIANIDKSVSKIFDDNIDAFAKKMI